MAVFTLGQQQNRYLLFTLPQQTPVICLNKLIMREIPSLRILCLRAVGPPTCSPEVAFGGPRVAAALKRSKSGIADDSDSDNEDNNYNAIEKEKTDNYDGDGMDKIITPEEPTLTSVLLKKLRNKESPMQAYEGLARPNANDVDIAHPWIMTVHPPREDGNNEPLLLAPAEGVDNMEVEVAAVTVAMEALQRQHRH